MKYLGIKLAEYIQNLYAKNYKSPGKKKKNNPKDINSGYIGYVHGLEDSNSQDVNFPKCTCNSC